MAKLSFTDQITGLGKRARTRARLMDAAVQVIAERGIETTSVNEIAAQAKVANGTFYNYFTDKNDIVGSISLKIATSITQQIDASMSDIEQAHERVAFATQQFVEIAASAPEWGWAFMYSATSMDGIRNTATKGLRNDIALGLSQGHFHVEMDNYLINTISAMVMNAISRRLAGNADKNATWKISDSVLRVLGVPADKATKTAHHVQSFKSLELQFPAQVA